VTVVAETLVRPVDAEACAAALAEAAREHRTVRVRGAGTKDYLGELGPADAVLETTALAGVVDHVPADLTVTVRSGTRFAELQAALRANGQRVPLDPPHASSATVGGIVAANSNGFGRQRYGGVRHLVIGTTTALADGTVAHSGGRVVKNVAGYDLNKLLIGSLGTLGVITEMTLKVLPLPRARAVTVARCARAADAFAIADALLRTPIRPSALVVDGARRGWAAVVAAEGEPAAVERAMVEAARAAERSAAPVERGGDPDEVLVPLRDLVETATDGAVLRAVLPLAAQRSFVDAAAALEGFDRCVADAGSGIVRIHLRGEDAAVLLAADTLMAGARSVGGSARIERRDAALRNRLPAWGPAPGGDFLMKRIKLAFDPRGTLEPGRGIVR
jgi:glycolate oxidase FAD binding subunit